MFSLGECILYCDCELSSSKGQKADSIDESIDLLAVISEARVISCQDRVRVGDTIKGADR